MAEKYLKYVQWMLYVLMGISAFLTILFYINPNPDAMLYWGYFLSIMAAVILVGIVVIQIVKNPKGSMKTLVIIGLMLLLGLVSFAISKNTLSPEQLEKYSISPTGVRWVGAGLVMTYVFIVAAIGVFIYTSLYRFFK